MGLLRTFSRNHSGAAAAEMALMLPLLTLLLFGGMEAGYFLWNEHKVVKAVRDGARFAGRQDFSYMDCASGGITSAGKTAGIEDNIKNVTRTGTTSSSATPVIRGWDNSEVSVTVSCDSGTTTGIYAAFPSTGAPRITVSASVPYPTLFGDIAFDLSSINLNSEAQAAVMGI